MKISRPVFLAGLPIAIIVLTSWLVISHWQTAHSHVLPKFDKADRIILGDEGHQPEVIVTGDKAREIVRVVTSAKCVKGINGLPPTTDVLFLNEVRFYQGTNYLGEIETSCGEFSTGGFDLYEADKDKLESLVDEPFQKALKNYQRLKS